MKDFIGPSKFISIFFKSDSISMNTLILIHTESNTLLRRSLDTIQVTEYCFEFAGKGSPCCNLCSSIPLLNISPEMPLGGAGEMLNRVNNSSPVCSVSTRFSVKN